MDGLVAFALPVSGLSDGLHRFSFELDADFFAHFEGSPVEDGTVQVEVELDKRPSLYVLQLRHRGSLRSVCDRCLEEFDLPISGETRLLVKFSEEPLPEEADVVYVHPDTARLQIARYIYESVVLSLPLTRVCDDNPELSCNEEVLRHLHREQPPAGGDPTANHPLKEALKGWKKEN